MKIYLSDAIFYNRAPFSEMKIHLKEDEISLIASANGRGKTTILSHIADAFHKIAKVHYKNEYEGREGKFYRISSQLESLDYKNPSIAYLRFKADTAAHIDYVNIRGPLSPEVYRSWDLPQNKIDYSSINLQLGESGFAKLTNVEGRDGLAKDLFSNNIITYFPAYRFEQPGYLNEPIP